LSYLYFYIAAIELAATAPADLDVHIQVARTDTFFQPPWFNEVQEEYFASREAVSLCDYSRLQEKLGCKLFSVKTSFNFFSFAKFDLWSAGKEVVHFLQNLCSNDIDIPIGKFNSQFGSLYWHTN